MHKKYYPFLIVSGILITIIGFLIYSYFSNPEISKFSGARAYLDVKTQVNFGARVPGSAPHVKTQSWITERLIRTGWSVSFQDSIYQNQTIRNIIASRGNGPLIIIGAHYDSRRLADKDPIPELAAKPVPGANDGASGVAVLLELARVLPNDLNHEIRLVFFDAEDQGNLNNWEWIVGSTAYAASLDAKPEAVIIIDMIGDKDLKVVKERYSTPELVDSIWLTAKQLGYGDIFVDSGSLQIMDDHLPFLNAGYAAVDIIDFTYPAWHTSQDTPNQVSASSLEIIGNVLYAWLCSR